MALNHFMNVNLPATFLSSFKEQREQLILKAGTITIGLAVGNIKPQSSMRNSRVVYLLRDGLAADSIKSLMSGLPGHTPLPVNAGEATLEDFMFNLCHWTTEISAVHWTSLPGKSGGWVVVCEEGLMGEARYKIIRCNVSHLFFKLF